jgi:precorrin-6B methylase 2
MEDRFHSFVTALPAMHSWDGGQTWNTGGFGEEHLRPLHAFLRARLPDRPNLLETGAGCSTITFLLLGPSRVTTIAPDAKLFGRIRSYCDANGIDTSPLSDVVGFSEWVLPGLAGDPATAPSLDFALIDGGHGWPTPFVDFFYINHMLRRGGYLMVDDVQLHSVKELARLLSRQPGFEPVLDIGKSLVFRKTSDERLLPDWVGQPYIRERSDEIGRLANPFAL